MNSFGRLDPAKRGAHHILDMARDGRPISDRAVERALAVLGDADGPWCVLPQPDHFPLPSQLEAA